MSIGELQLVLKKLHNTGSISEYGNSNTYCAKYNMFSE